ncbi:cache domain-containing protein [Neptuniibacter sp.]|uniref:cache domain-containing protein n=1 Tax=Neptuniibacter sp. TaxID=1962643 RepID=UPI00262E4469|nr:cache domain-containing protein [Neptuniibacter sp.]MCP4595552.1 HAMP domain-containing protein [Neptuniibacter sp.]
MIKFWQKLHSSLRHKLLLLTLLPLALTALGFALMAAYWTTSYTDRQLYMKVSADLSVASGTLNIMQQEQEDTLQQLGNSFEFRTNLQLGNSRALQVQLLEVKLSRSLDFLRFIAAEDIEQIREESFVPLVKRLSNGESLKGITVLNANELDSITFGLADKAQITLIDTPRAVPSERENEDRAMVLRALVPVTDDFGELIGILDSGQVLNNSTRAVDTIRDLVYGKGSLPDKGIGTVTLFLDDVRISTNVPQDNPNQIKNKNLSLKDRAIGTRVSAEVRKKVLLQGETWIDRAFVVNDWYISAYKPLLDFNNRKVGMIYAGFTEAPFSRIYYKTLFESATFIALIMLVSAVVVINHTRLLLKPLAKIHSVATSIGDGSMQPRIGKLDSSDELVDLAEQFDVMLDLLEKREQQIRSANDQLEITVEKRTRSLRKRTEALKDHIRLLKSTRKQLLDKEKLAVLGELTAGIAHEINNPAAVILGNMDLLVAELGEAVEPARGEVDMVIQQVYRIRSLINNLLQYSRPGHYVESYEHHQLNQVVDDTLQLVSHALEKQQVGIIKDYQADCPVEVNCQQVQQVLVNLILNASHALEGPGKVELITENWIEDNQLKGAIIKIVDKGKGISKGHLAQIFDPFFTTKKSGTGLGLSVSYSIIRRHGGDIKVESEESVGTTFSVYLLRDAEVSGDGELEGILDGLASAERTNRRATSTVSS